MSTCPCRIKESNQITYKDCCEPIILGKSKAKTAESLMRSRYTAYTLKNIDYIDKTQTYGPDEKFDKEEALSWAQDSDWEGLTIHNVTKGLETDTNGVVEFSCFFKHNKTAKDHVHKERAVFTKKDGVWFFDRGQIYGTGPIKRDAPKVGRNDLCPCGSNKKYKKCCGA